MTRVGPGHYATEDGTWAIVRRADDWTQGSARGWALMLGDGDLREDPEDGNVIDYFDTKREALKAWKEQV